MEAYSYKLKDHQPTPFQKDGKPLFLCFVPSGEFFLTETENIQQGRAMVSNNLRDLLHDFESLPSEALKLFTSNHAEISITDALQQNAYGDRDGLHSYLKVENALKDLGVKREHPFSFSGEPLTRETFSEACYGFYGVRLENGFRAMERKALQKLAVLVREFAQVLDLLIRPRPEDGLRMPKPRHLLIGSDELVPIETGEVDVLVDDVPLDAGRIRLHLEPEAEWQVFQCFHGITSFLKSCFVGTDSD